MPEKRCAIVRVDNSCPAMSDGLGCILSRNMFHCKCGEDIKNYGDTKEQLIRKVAQALKGTLWNDRKGMSYEEIAKKIIEFLGVE